MMIARGHSVQPVIFLHNSNANGFARVNRNRVNNVAGDLSQRCIESSHVQSALFGQGCTRFQDFNARSHDELVGGTVFSSRGASLRFAYKLVILKFKSHILNSKSRDLRKK